MTVWLLQQTLSAEEEGAITTRDHLLLPYENLPDLTYIDSPNSARKMLRTLHADAPPETIARRFESFWNIHSNLQNEDLIAVPLLHTQQIALATITGSYTHRIDEHGHDQHLIPVRFPCAPVPMRLLRKFPELLSARAMHEITDRDARIALLGALPHSYNRFYQWRWLMAVLTGFGLLRMSMSYFN